MGPGLVISSSPHQRRRMHRQHIMYLVLAALVPATVGGIYFFGLKAALIIGVSVLSAWILDVLLQYATGQNLGWFNGSAIISGLLLALVLPPTVPLWLPVVGVAITIALGKYAFGMGNNIFNPALVGRAFLVTSWPALMSTWVSPDGVTQATPLGGADAGYGSLLMGNVGGCIGETSALLLLAGGLFLIALRIIDWKIPLTYVGTVALLTAALGFDPVFHMLSGGLLIGAFFMATDYVTIPLTTRGRFYFALGCGVLTSLFRLYSDMPEGVMYSILLMNAASPLIERLSIPRPFGAKRDTA